MQFGIQLCNQTRSRLSINYGYRSTRAAFLLRLMICLFLARHTHRPCYDGKSWCRNVFVSFQQDKGKKLSCLILKFVLISCRGAGLAPPDQAAQIPIQPGLECQGMGHPQLLWAACSSASPHYEYKFSS